MTNKASQLPPARPTLMCAQAGLVLLVWLRLYAVRLTEIRVRRIDPQQLARADEAVKLLANNSAADNLRNLFEIPVLFFAICLALYVTGFVTPLQESLAWGFGSRSISRARPELRSAYFDVELSSAKTAEARGRKP